MQDPKLHISTRLMYEEALQRGIACTIINPDILKMERNGTFWYTGGSRTSYQSSLGRTIADFKHITKPILLANNIPTAKAVTIVDRTKLDALSALQFPVVMKPSFGCKGKDVVIGIPTIEAAAKEIERFHEVSDDLPVVFEELLAGEEFRILCIDYAFVAAAYREPAHVVGDGHQTINELIVEKNRHPWRGRDHLTPLSTIEIDDALLTTLSEQQLTLDSVLPSQQKVFVRKTANLSTGGEASNISDQVCAENIALFEKIATVCDLNTVGIDVKCQTLTTPIELQPQAGILEINASPGLRMHHFPMNGEPVNAAKLILDMVVKHL